MKTAENGPEFDRAYGTLELPVNASREAVEQSYNDLRKVWAPERFQTDERLKRRAEEQLARIEEAYLLLKNHHSRQDPLLDELYGKGKKIKPRPPVLPKTEPHATGMTPSLADSVFSEPGSRSSKGFPVGLLVAGIVVVIVLGILLASRLGGNGSSSEPKGATPATPRSTPSAQTAPPAAANAPREPAQSTPASPTGESKNAEARPAPANDRVESPRSQPPPQPAPVNRGPKPRTEPTPAARAKPSVGTANPIPSREPQIKPELVRGPEEGGVAPEEERRVMNVLGQKSPAAQSIMEGTTDQFQVMSWRVTKKDGGEFWAHLVAQSRATGNPTHFIWAVDPGKETVRPMSQAARDLEKGVLGSAQTGS